MHSIPTHPSSIRDSIIMLTTYSWFLPIRFKFNSITSQLRLKTNAIKRIFFLGFYDSHLRHQKALQKSHHRYNGACYRIIWSFVYLKIYILYVYPSALQFNFNFHGFIIVSAIKMDKMATTIKAILLLLPPDTIIEIT